jgi:hypothetical protein
MSDKVKASERKRRRLKLKDRHPRMLFRAFSCLFVVALIYFQKKITKHKPWYICTPFLSLKNTYINFPVSLCILQRSK